MGRETSRWGKQKESSWVLRNTKKIKNLHKAEISLSEHETPGQGYNPA